MKYRNLKRYALAGLLSIFILGSAHAVQITVDGNTPLQTMDGFGGSIMNWMTQNKDPAWAQFCARDLGVSMLRLDLHPDIYTGGNWGSPVTWTSDINTNMNMMTLSAGTVDIAGVAARNLYNNRLDEMKIMM